MKRTDSHEEIIAQIRADQQHHMRTQESLISLSKQLWHDCRNIFWGLAQLSNMIRKNIGWIGLEIRSIKDIPCNPPLTAERLDALTVQLSALERMSDAFSTGMIWALRLAERIPDDVKMCLEYADVWYSQKESHDIVSAIREIILISWNQKEVKIIAHIPDQFSRVLSLDLVGFQRMMGNFIQNAIRYRKIDQEIAQMEISISSNTSNDIVLSIKDYGQGMCAKDIESYKQSHKRPVAYSAEAHSDSHRIGAASIMQVIDSHGWKIDIKSEVGEFIIFSITIPAVDLIQSKV